MAKIVVSGCSDCPYFAKVEILADKLKINLPEFHVHKIVKTRAEWSHWANELAKNNNWKVFESPIIWRELVDRGGKGYLIGGANEFQEYIKCYYDISSDFTSERMQNVAKDNIKFKEEEDKELREYKALSVPTKVCICGASNHIVPHFILKLASGNLIDTKTELSIMFQDSPENIPFLKSLQMGTFDLAYSLVRSISITEDMEAALVDSSYVIIFDDIRQLPEEGLDGWLKRYKDHYEYMGYVLEKYCSAHVKVVLVGENIDSQINIAVACIHTKLNVIPKFNVVGLSRPFEQNARSVVAKKLSVNPSNVHNIIVWGNVGGKRFFDISNAKVQRYDGSIVGPDPFSVSAEKTIWDKKWLKNDMENEMQQRFSKISELNGGNGSTLAVANALNTFLYDWINGDSSGNIHSLIVASDGRYGVPEGMVFSMPVTLYPAGYWALVQDVDLTELQFKRITECMQEIKEQLLIIYPQENTNQSEMVLDKASVESQLNALLEEVYPKERLAQLKRLLNDSLTIEEKLELSNSKELLLRTISDLEKTSKSSAKEPSDVEVVPEVKVETVVTTGSMNESNVDQEEKVDDGDEARSSVEDDEAK